MLTDGASKGRYSELVTMICWVQRPAREANHSPSNISEVRNELTGTSTPVYALMASTTALPLLLPSRSAQKRKKCAWDASVVLLRLTKVWVFWHSMGRIMCQNTDGRIEGSVRIFGNFWQSTHRRKTDVTGTATWGNGRQYSSKAPSALFLE